MTEIQPRLKYPHIAPEAFRAMMGMETYLHTSGLEASLMELVKVRASQINACAYCLDMHWKDARAGGETEERLYSLNAWRESPVYSGRERAALAWTEALTTLSEGHVPDAGYAAAKTQFNDKELVDLSWAIAAINAWNRMGVAFRPVPGKYVSNRSASGAGSR